MYCDGQCKNLDEKKHKCKFTGEKLSYVRYAGLGFIVHEHNGDQEQKTGQGTHTGPQGAARSSVDGTAASR